MNFSREATGAKLQSRADFGFTDLHGIFLFQKDFSKKDWASH